MVESVERVFADLWCMFVLRWSPGIICTIVPTCPYLGGVNNAIRWVTPYLLTKAKMGSGEEKRWVLRNNHLTRVRVKTEQLCQAWWRRKVSFVSPEWHTHWVCYPVWKKHQTSWSCLVHGLHDNTIKQCRVRLHWRLQFNYSKECVFRAFMVMVVYQLKFGCQLEFQLHP